MGIYSMLTTATESIKEIPLHNNQEDIRYLVWYYLPETGKLAVDEHIYLRVLNSSSQINVSKSMMQLVRLPQQEVEGMIDGVGGAKSLLFGCMIWDKTVFCASVDTDFYYTVVSKEH